MKYLLLVVLAVASVAKADPIQDNVVHGYKAAWMPSSATPCPKVCAAADSSKAESEAFLIPSLPNKITSVCKGVTTTSGAYEGKGTLYGNNFQSPGREKVCLA